MRRRSFLTIPAALVLPSNALPDPTPDIETARGSGRPESFFSWTSRQLMALYLQERLDVRSRVCVVLGAYATGKTALLCGLVNHASYATGTSSMYISAAEDVRRVQELLCHARTRFDPGLASAGVMSPVEYADFRDQVDQPAKRSPIFVDLSTHRGPYGGASGESSLSDLELYACILRDGLDEPSIPAATRPALLVVDGAQFLGPPDSVCQSLRNLYKFASELDIAVVLTVRSTEDTIRLRLQLQLQQFDATLALGLSDFIDHADHLIALSRPKTYLDEPEAPDLSAVVLHIKTRRSTTHQFYWT